MDKGSVGPADLLLVGEDGRPTKRAAARPSAEVLLHVTLAREAGAGAVFHTHSVWGTLLGEHFVRQGGFSIGGYEMLKGIDGVSSHAEEVFVPVVQNSEDMTAVGSELTRTLRQRSGLRGLLIAGHGLYSWGRGLEEAQRHVEIFEFLFQLVGRRVNLAPFDG